MIIFLFAAISVFGCATAPMFVNRLSVADDIVVKTEFIKEYIKAGGFTLMTYQRFNRCSDSVTIYIEGDGRAWETKHKLSDDPTPSNPVALRLAAVDPSGNVAYIARPGQYYLPGFLECDSKYWSGFRFSPEVVKSFNIAIDILKGKSGSKHVELVGYSGGGAIAILVAARRNDVITLRTVAGNLDSKALSAYHRVSQLNGSMNPLDVAEKVAYIPQRHFVSVSDSVVPLSITESFAGKIGDYGYESITIAEGTNHAAGWQKVWSSLLDVPLYKQE